MATTSTSSVLQPLQQQQQQQSSTAGETLTNVPSQGVTSTPTSSSSGAWQSSGSIGPFFAVISVLTVLAVISCYLGRRYSRKAETPLENIIKGQGYWGWVKRKCRQCTGKETEIGTKVMAFGEGKLDGKARVGDA